jgi:hypothetical protein
MLFLCLDALLEKKHRLLVAKFLFLICDELLLKALVSLL